VPGLLSPTQYWFFLSSDQPLRKAKEKGFVSGDLLLMETDPTRFPAKEWLWEHLCVVKNPRGREPRVMLGLVFFYEADVDAGPERLEAETFERDEQGLEFVDEFLFRRYSGGQVKSLHRQVPIKRKGQVERELTPEEIPVMAPTLPKIQYGDIVAVWTGILLRHGYIRLA
jgi:hypothetical protein